MSGSLSEDDLREAAEEAGISPHELRDALVKREPMDLAVRPDTSLLGPPSRGETATFVEDRVAASPGDALEQARAALEKTTGLHGHKQTGGSIDLVDDRAGVTYRVRATDDGAGGALVRLDVDPAASRGERALATTGILASGAAVAVVGLLISKTLLFAGVALGVVAGIYYVRSLARQNAAVRNAHQIAATALTRTQHGAPGLPPAADP